MSLVLLDFFKANERTTIAFDGATGAMTGAIPSTISRSALPSIPNAYILVALEVSSFQYHHVTFLIFISWSLYVNSLR